MLKSLDILIGLAVIMLALSMAVTMITQFVTTVVNSRGRHLKRGLSDLLGLLDPKITKGIADKIATAVLEHPLVSSTSGRLGSVVHREEFTKLVMGLTDPSSSLAADAKSVLTKTLQDNGIADPQKTLETVRDVTLRLEAASPQLASDVRQTMAILEGARSEFVGKVHNWFDQTMDRVAQRFTATTRAITFGAAVLVAGGLQVDTVSLVNRLSADDTLRKAFVEQAVKASDANAPTPGTTDQEREREYLAFLAENGLISIPTVGDWVGHWSAVNPMGVLITSLLLSLGAPFWYKALGSLLQLRSVLAAKDDDQRQKRQETGSGAPAGGGGG